MTEQLRDRMLYRDEEFQIETYPLNQYFKLTGIDNPYGDENRGRTSLCWNGYVATWALEDGRLYLSNIEDILVKGKEALNHEAVFPGQTACIFAHWYSGEINVPLNDAVKRDGDDDQVAVERTLKLAFQSGILISEEVVLKYPLTPNAIEIGLTSTDVYVRREFADSLDGYMPTPEQIERGMLDEDGKVRMAFIMHARKEKHPFTPEQLERALTDNNVHIRDYVTSAFREYKFTPFQLMRALNDESDRVKNNILLYYGDEIQSAQMIELDRLSQDEKYHQARTVVIQKIDYWNEIDNPGIYFVLNTCQQLAAAGYGKAYYLLSLLYSAKQDGDGNQDRALNFERLALDWCHANQDNDDMHLWNDLGELCQQQEEEDCFEKAAFWYRKAAENGYDVAQYNLADCYRFGLGVAEDLSAAIEWCKRSAKQGNKLAIANLAHMYEHDGRTNHA
ncbi:MAG: sel1 repeat family protein [Nitrosomonadales bacterium]|nr:sel1 repeat family protein [Nitrosomonadales bacterium]